MVTVENWEIELEGSEADLALISDLNSDAVSIEIVDGRYFMKFKPQPDEQPIDAFVRSQKYVESLNAICRLRFPGYGDLSVSRDLRNQNRDGSSGITIVVKPAKIAVRTFPATITAEGKTHKPIDLVNDYVDVAVQDPTVSLALRLRNSNEFDWVQMYRVLEIINSDRNITDAGWVSNSQWRLFKHTANSTAAIGDKARHGHSPQVPPANPMTEEEAVCMTDTILKCWLDEKCR